MIDCRGCTSVADVCLWRIISTLLFSVGRFLAVYSYKIHCPENEAEMELVCLESTKNL